MPAQARAPAQAGVRESPPTSSAYASVSFPTATSRVMRLAGEYAAIPMSVKAQICSEARTVLGSNEMVRAHLFALLAIPALSWMAAAAQQQAPQPERGEEIMFAACTSCHDTRPIDTQALDQEAWTKQVKAMIEKGADVKADDVRPLVDYLVKYHGPMPDGPGKELVLNICTQCHDLQRVRRTRLTPEGWVALLETMLNEGAPLSEKDFPDVLRYLARNFRPER